MHAYPLTLLQQKGLECYLNHGISPFNASSFLGSVAIHAELVSIVPIGFCVWYHCVCCPVGMDPKWYGSEECSLPSEDNKISYAKTLEGLCLDQDFRACHDDLTEIGERGITMSGIQKQRVQLLMQSIIMPISISWTIHSVRSMLTRRPAFSRQVLHDYLIHRSILLIFIIFMV